MRLPVTPRTMLLRELRDDVRRSYRAGRVIVAVDGRDGAGVAIFADGLADVFSEEGASVFRSSIDGFRRSRADPRSGDSRSFVPGSADFADEQTFLRVLVDPFRAGATVPSTGFQLAAWDADRGVAAEPRWVTGPEDAVLIVDGTLLNTPTLRGLWHWSVWLSTPSDAATATATASDVDVDEASSRAATAIVDNADPQHPRRAHRNPR